MKKIVIVILFLVLGYAGYYYYQLKSSATDTDIASSTPSALETQSIGQARKNPFSGASLNPLQGYRNPFAPVASGGFAADSARQKLASLSYPIRELNNCSDQAGCQAFCASADNMMACLDYAERQALLPPKDIAGGRAVFTILAGGKLPGGCKNIEDCEKYCSGDKDQVGQCLVVVKDLNLLSPEQFAWAKRLGEALFSGKKLPGDCRTWAECRSYCDESGHFSECIDFAEAAKLISKGDAEVVRRVGGLSTTTNQQ